MKKVAKKILDRSSYLTNIENIRLISSYLTNIENTKVTKQIPD